MNTNSKVSSILCDIFNWFQIYSINTRLVEMVDTIDSKSVPNKLGSRFEPENE